MDDLKEIEARVYGKVQGVFFRDYVQKKASALYVTGFAENTPDGCVHVVAQGREARINALIEYLHKGPFGARVSRVDLEWKEPSEFYEKFEAIYG